LLDRQRLDELIEEYGDPMRQLLFSRLGFRATNDLETTPINEECPIRDQKFV
jgi:hypothetical protein